MSNELPVESPVLVNEVDRQPHEGVAGSWRPHICGEGGTCEVSLYRVDDVEDLFLDLGRLHLHQLRVSGAMLENLSRCCQEWGRMQTDLQAGLLSE